MNVRGILMVAGLLLGLVVLPGCGERSPEDCLNKAVVKANANEWDKVEKLTARALEMAPENVNALTFRAIACDKLGQRDQALDCARQAAELNPDSFAANYTLGRLYAMEPRRCGEAERVLRRALKLRSNHIGTLILLCNAAAETNSRHLVTYLKLLGRNPEFNNLALLHNQLGIAYLRCNAKRSAHREFLQTFNLGRNNPVILLNTAIYFDRYDHFSRNSKAVAKSLYQAYLRKTANDAKLYAAPRQMVMKRLVQL